MLSQHRKFLVQKQLIIMSKEEEMEQARLDYLAKMEAISKKDNALMREQAKSKFKPEIIHGLK